MPKSIRTPNSCIRSIGEPLTKARAILEHSHDTAHSLLKVFDIARKSRTSGPSTTTDEEQDILRAMLVFSAAGLDAMIKQVIRDALPALMSLDDKVSKGLETFISRQLKRQFEQTPSDSTYSFLARILASESHYSQVVREYVEYLSAGSLQSPEELMRSIFALGLEPKELQIDLGKLRPIFETRNCIIHELDINFEVPRRNRRSRARVRMIDDTNMLLAIGEYILLAVSHKLEGTEKTNSSTSLSVLPNTGST